MPFVEVWVDDPDEQEIEDFDDDELLDELDKRGYTVYGKGHRPNIPRVYIDELYTTYITMSPEFFKKELEKFFKDHVEY